MHRRALFLAGFLCVCGAAVGSGSTPHSRMVMQPPALRMRASQPSTVPAAAKLVDVAHSSLRILVCKSGLFSALAHNHEIEAPLEWGEVNETGDISAELRVDARKLRVLDPEAAESTRAQVQKTMAGPEVLDAERFREIHFRSTRIEPEGADRWRVTGNLDLHGQTRQVTIEMAGAGGLYRGTTQLKQTDFGISPVSAAGGTVKVKNEITIEAKIAVMK